MATNELQARITADISGLESGLKKAQKLQDDYGKAIAKTQNEIAQNIQTSKQLEASIEQLHREFKAGAIGQKQYQKELQRLQRNEKETSVDTANLRKELNRLKRDQKDLASSTNSAAGGVNKLGKAGANATPTVIELSRVIQDAPYGIQGAANNIQQLTTNFGYLRKSAGGTVPALKAFAGSFLGPAGIVFAVSTITSLLVTYGDELFNAASATDELAESNADFVASAKTEIQTLNSLVSIATNEAESKERRERALNRINKDYGDYLGNLTLESLKTDEVRRKIDELTQSLISQAKVRGAEAVLEEKYKQLAIDTAKAQERAGTIVENQLSKNRKATLTQIYGYETLLSSLEKQRKEGKNVDAAIDSTQKKIQDLRSTISDAGRTLEKETLLSDFIKKETQDSIDEIEDFEKVFGSVVSDSLNFDTADDKGVITNRLKEAQKEGENLSKLLSKIDAQIEDTELADEAAQNLYDANQIAKELGSTVKDLSSLGGLDFDPQQGIPETVKELEKVEALILSISKAFPDIDLSGLGNMSSEELIKFQEDLNTTLATAKAFESGISSAFKSIASNLTSSLDDSAGGFEAFAGKLAQTAIELIGILLSQSIANAIAGATAAGTATGPLAIISTPAFIATAVSGVLGAFAAIPSFATGGIVPGGSFQGDRVPALLNSGEMILNAGQQANLFGMLNGSLASLQGQSAGSDIVGEVVLRGQTQLIQLKRTEKKFKRYYNS